MPSKLTRSRKNVLIKLESILGGECYNANIQNYGPGGSREADGRSFRYPLMIRFEDGAKQKIRSSSIPELIPDSALRSGYYAFGANQLDVMSALEKMLSYLEKNHGLQLEPGR